MNNDFIFCKMPEVTGKTAPLFCMARTARAFWRTEFIFRLFRMTGAVLPISSISSSVMPAQREISKWKNVFLYPSRRFKIVDQESPAWAPSRISISKGKYHHDGDGTILHHDKSLKTRLLKPMDKSFCSSLCFLLLLKKNRIFAGTGIDIFNYTKGEKHFYVCLYILE